jgi:hypothetical protein
MSRPERLDAASFALLRYLAEELMARRQDGLQRQANGYRLTDAEGWRRICEEAECSWAAQALIPSDAMTRWVNKINTSVEPQLDLVAPRLRLVQPLGRLRRYVLTSGIRPDNIVIRD